MVLVVAVALFSGACAAPATPTDTPIPPGEPAATDTVAPPVQFEDPYAYCAAVGTIGSADARYTGPELPERLVEVMVAQGIVTADAPPEFQKNAVWRCANKRVLICHFGANLPCLEKADISTTPAPAVVDFCKANPTSDVVPADVTGRATVYEWKCAQGKPETVKQVLQVDAQGFLADFWHELPAK